MKLLRIYIAAPYSSAPAANTDAAIAIGELLHNLGFVPYVPHMSFLWDQRYPHSYAEWLAYDLHWLRVCEAVFRMPVESVGADGEVAEAERLGIPVFTDVDALRAWGVSQNS